MSGEGEQPLQFRDRETLEVQKRFREEIERTVRAFSTILNGEGAGGKPQEKALAEIRSGMDTLEELQRSLPTDPLDEARIHNIEAALLIAGMVVWDYLSEQQRREFLP